MTNAALPSGISLDELDPAVRPQDDLYRHVNGQWLARTEIPADKARWGSFHMLAEEAEKAVQAIILEAQDAPDDENADPEQRKVGDLYASFMDEDLVEALGATPVAGQLAAIENIGSIEQLVRTTAQLERAGVSGFLQLYVDNDPGNPERYLVLLEQGGISLPDESYYRDDKFASIRTAYVSHIEQMFELVAEGLPGGTQFRSAVVRAQHVFDIETAIAAVHWDNVRSRDSEATYNLHTWDEAAGLFAGASKDRTLIDAWLQALGAPEGAFQEVVVRQPSFFAGLAPLLVPSKLAAWKDWLAWKVVHGAAPYLSRDFVASNFGFYGRTLSGTPEIRDRWKRGVSLVESVLGEAVGKIYVDRHFPAEAKASMDVLVANLVEAYRQSISTLTWMGNDTRKRALEKLEQFTPKIGFPSKWRDYSSLDVQRTDLLGNVRRASLFEFRRELGKIGKPLDREEWFMTPQTINAYYNPGFNEIVFPAAILQFPFFEQGRDAAANYGAIGAVIGHEIGHGFDDQGSKYDGTGKLTDWWTAKDRKAFEKRTASLIAQFNALAPAQVPDHHVNGALTIGENIGDLGGLSIAWKAYLISLAGQEPPVIDGLTGGERFFLSWAQAWQQKGRDAEVIRLLAIDPHSPNEFRCNQIVRNIDEFYQTFAVTPADALWLDPSQRVTIW
ncbi:MAG TPA: M13-type metalloendopeptidase [Mycetocola sp.]|jgi:putative endopeptidase|uniref:M13 family metallopeptidase n=1 Tax=Mycetocola sp. TaxID=1871042 RepID=UPI0026389838|nr:M13-type metalloendopeptidase [Mycetocola sp.]MCU1560256.1 Zn+2 metalloendopeptidase PepO [Mycetocola sp.]HEV7849024.1 M13-type metalloendopeptidase [Mycetocola sp.]